MNEDAEVLLLRQPGVVPLHEDAAVFSGMLGVTSFGLFLTPAFYVVLRKTSIWFWGGRQHAAPAHHRPHAAAVEAVEEAAVTA